MENRYNIPVLPLLIIAKKQYGLKPSLHTISNSIGQILFKRGDIRNFYNKPDESVNVPEDDSYRRLTLWEISPDSNVLNYGKSIFL